VLGGRVDLFFDISSTARAQVDAGSVRALAVSSAERQPMHPEVPSVAETGVAALDMESWFGLFAPAAVPAPTLARLRAELAKVLADREVAALFAKTGGRLLTLSPAETEALLKRRGALDQADPRGGDQRQPMRSLNVGSVRWCPTPP